MVMRVTAPGTAPFLQNHTWTTLATPHQEVERLNRMSAAQNLGVEMEFVRMLSSFELPAYRLVDRELTALENRYGD